MSNEPKDSVLLPDAFDEFAKDVGDDWTKTKPVLLELTQEEWDKVIEYLNNPNYIPDPE